MSVLHSKRAGKSSIAKHAARLVARATMGFLLQNRDDVLEAFNLGRGCAFHDRLLKRGKVAAHAPRHGPTFGSQFHPKCPAIGLTNFPRDHSASSQPIENTGQRRSLMGEAAMKIGNFRGRGMVEQGENVRLALS
jgi:hypothetical protein